jgi:hypothetical protein
MSNEKNKNNQSNKQNQQSTDATSWNGKSMAVGAAGGIIITLFLVVIFNLVKENY